MNVLVHLRNMPELLRVRAWVSIIGALLTAVMTIWLFADWGMRLEVNGVSGFLRALLIEWEYFLLGTYGLIAPLFVIDVLTRKVAFFQSQRRVTFVRVVERLRVLIFCLFCGFAMAQLPHVVWGVPMPVSTFLLAFPFTVASWYWANDVLPTRVQQRQTVHA